MACRRGEENGKVSSDPTISCMDPVTIFHTYQVLNTIIIMAHSLATCWLGETWYSTFVIRAKHPLCINYQWIIHKRHSFGRPGLGFGSRVFQQCPRRLGVLGDVLQVDGVYFPDNKKDCECQVSHVTAIFPSTRWPFCKVVSKIFVSAENESCTPCSCEHRVWARSHQKCSS